MRTGISPSVLSYLEEADRIGLIEADKVVFTVKTYDEVPEEVQFAFWTEPYSEASLVISPFTGLVENHTFIGDGAILDVGETPRTSNLQIKRKSITMSAIHPAVVDMWTGHDMRMAKVAVYQTLFDPETRSVVWEMSEFAGELNGAPKSISAAGSESSLKFDIVSDVRQLTLTNSERRSNSHQMSRQNDGFHKYIGVVGAWKIPYGQETKSNTNKKSSGFLTRN